MEDNYTKIYLDIVSSVLTHHTAQFLKPDIFDYLKSVTACTQKVVYLEFTRETSSQKACSCIVDILIDEAINGVTTDDSGNEWQDHTVRVEMTWPSHGEASTKCSSERIAFLAEVCNFATDIEKKFCEPMWRLVNTAEDVKKREAGDESRRISCIIYRIVNEVQTKGMRVGTTKFAHHVDLCKIPRDTHRVTLASNNKTYLLCNNLEDKTECMVVRVA